MQIKIFISKVASFLTIFAMVLSMVGLTPATANAAANYQISGALTVDGFDVDASGVASANTYTGQGDNQYISLTWNFTGNTTVWVTLKDHNTLNYLSDKGPNGVITDTSWSASHTYGGPGTYTIKALIHHSQPSGNESGSQVFTQTITIAQCNDGLDNDGDSYSDYPNDPGCTSPTDNDESPVNTPDPVYECSDGVDNADTEDSLIDANDPGCSSPTDNNETDPAPVYECSDNIDNDLDGQTDFPNDLGCTSTNDNSESPNPVAQYTLTVNSGGNGTAGTSGSYNDGTIVVLTATPGTNYHFVNWTGDADCTDGSVTVSSNISCTANFAIDTFTITATSGANGLVSPAGVTVESYGASQAYQITPNSGYYVSDVLVDSVSVGTVTVYNFLNVTANHTISATFAINPACSDEADNDGDDLTDANDSGCWTNPNDSETYDPNDNDETDLILGCTDETAFNYDGDANYDDGSCQPVVTGCMDNTANNYNDDANTPDNSCTYTVYGCTDEAANNYNPNANSDDESCTYSEGPVYGCTDPEATNYNPNADIDNESCNYPQEPVYACSDDSDNDGDDLTDANDPNCHTDGNENNPESYDPTDNDESSSRGGGQTGSRSGGGQVLGASTSCGIYVDKFLRKGYKGNNSDAVNKLQQFLNDYTAAGIAVDSNFGPKTEKALKAFQTAHADKVLTPWNLTAPTGIFYLTTQTEVNNIMCPELALPIPANLVPFSKNPEAPKA